MKPKRNFFAKAVRRLRPQVIPGRRRRDDRTLPVKEIKKELADLQSV